MTTRASFAAFVLVLSMATVARAHPVTVDGEASEWLGRAPTQSNTALVARGAGPIGELVWSDASGDERTDFASPDGRVDLVSFATTGDATNLYFLVEVADLDVAVGDGAAQIQVAIDLDRVAGSGQEFLAAFSDTQVSADARWEFLVQTTASPDLGVQVYDSTFAVAGTGTIARSGDRYELAVPWSALGLSAPPAAVRMSVALFRQDASAATYDISGASDALDVLSNHGDPGTAPNTFDEVSDGVLDHSLDVHFDAAGEVIAPLQVVRYLYDAGSFVEHVVVRNASGAALALGDFAVGDEETANQPEGMRNLPVRSLAAGAELVLSLGVAGAFETAFGFAPGAEIGDLAPRGRWSAGTVALEDDGDELLILDRSDTIVDVVAFEAGGYAGVGNGPTAAAGELSVREPVDADTDGSADFVLRSACADDGGCGACGLCLLGACGLQPEGTTCDDSDACTTGESCDGSGVCGGGTATCEDGGVADDGGTSLMDGGSPADAGVDGGSAPDASSGRDGGAAIDAGTGSREEGGCAAAPVPTQAPTLTLLGLALLTLRRRSR